MPPPTAPDAPEISVFVPCYNEGPRVESTVETICAACAGLSFEIIIANDGSRDDSLERMRAAKAAHPEVKITLIDSPANRGMGYFYLLAAYVATGRYYIYVPGDNVVPVEQLKELFQRRGRADIVIPYYEELDRRSALRLRLSRAFTSLVNLLGGHAIHYYNGSVLHRRENVCDAPTLTSGPAYQAELISNLLLNGATALQVKVPIRTVAKSGTLRPRNFWPAGLTLLRILKRRLRARRR
ncbi:MAG: glycosyltransferase family 2 protein [Rhodospirillales bacterium]